MVRLGGDGRVRPTTTVDAMAARLGRVLYLAFTGLAVILAVFCLVIAGLIIVNGDPYAAPWVAVLYGWMPVASWLIGRVQAPRFALSFGTVARLAQVQESGSTGGPP